MKSLVSKVQGIWKQTWEGSKGGYSIERRASSACVAAGALALQRDAFDWFSLLAPSGVVLGQ